LALEKSRWAAIPEDQIFTVSGGKGRRIKTPGRERYQGINAENTNANKPAEGKAGAMPKERKKIGCWGQISKPKGGTRKGGKKAINSKFRPGCA